MMAVRLLLGLALALCFQAARAEPYLAIRAGLKIGRAHV